MNPFGCSEADVTEGAPFCDGCFLVFRIPTGSPDPATIAADIDAALRALAGHQRTCRAYQNVRVEETLARHERLDAEREARARGEYVPVGATG